MEKPLLAGKAKRSLNLQMTEEKPVDYFKIVAKKLKLGLPSAL